MGLVGVEEFLDLFSLGNVYIVLVKIWLFFLVYIVDFLFVLFVIWLFSRVVNEEFVI